MAGKDIITMSQKELKRLHIIHKILDRRLKQIDAVELLELCAKQISRIAGRVREEGDKGIIHRSRGEPSHNTTPKKKKDKIISLYKGKYNDFGPLLASEKLFEIDKLKISDETLRNWLIAEGLWIKNRKRRKHRKWRERRHFFGEMEQIDGSHHDWFEGRAPKCVLMGHIDDATSNVYVRFFKYEGTFPFMDSFKCYIKKYDIPHSVYLDMHSTYKSPKKPTIEDQLENREPLSEVERALKELGVEVIHARSPQAKGRVERLFKTFQDRVIKEMRLKGIKAIEEANKFLKYYLPIFNKRFSVQALEEGDLHRPIEKGVDLDAILCIKTDHPLRNDFTIAHDKKLYQILDSVRAKKLTVEERINGRMFITYAGEKLKYKEITRRPARKEVKKPYIFKIKKVVTPAADHPWRGHKVRYSHINTCSQKEKVAQKEKGLLLPKT